MGPGVHKSRTLWPINICYVAPNICETEMCDFSYVALQTPKVLRWLLDFWKIGTEVILLGRPFICG